MAEEDDGDFVDVLVPPVAFFPLELEVPPLPVASSVAEPDFVDFEPLVFSSPPVAEVPPVSLRVFEDFSVPVFSLPVPAAGEAEDSVEPLRLRSSFVPPELLVPLVPLVVGEAFERLGEPPEVAS